MNKTKENLILHPVRIRILLAVAGRQATAQQLASELPDIPQASLYRNLKILADAGILVVIRERRVHNTVEKTYALPEKSSLLTPEDLKNATSEDYLRLFTQFLGQQLGYFARYLQKDEINLVRDHILFQMTPFYLSEAETQELAQTLKAVLLPYLKNEPSPERRRSIVGLTFMPDVVSVSQLGNSRITKTSQSTQPHLPLMDKE